MTSPIAFTSTTPRHDLPLLYVGQSQKELTVNETIVACDFLIDATIETVVAASPSAPSPGQMWLVGANPAGDFAGESDSLAGWTESGWRFFKPREGMRVFDRSTSAFRVYRQGWVSAAAPQAPSGGSVIDVEARATLAALSDALKLAGILSGI